MGNYELTFLFGSHIILSCVSLRKNCFLLFEIMFSALVSNTLNIIARTCKYHPSSQDVIRDYIWSVLGRYLIIIKHFIMEFGMFTKVRISRLLFLCLGCNRFHIADIFAKCHFIHFFSQSPCLIGCFNNIFIRHHFENSVMLWNYVLCLFC